MKSGTAWKTVPEAHPRAVGAGLVKHPTTAWPPSHGPRTPVDSETTTLRRARRPPRQSPTVPWPYLITSVMVLSVLIMLVVKQRADLIKENNRLVDLRVQRSQVLKERSELKLSIQRLTALERVDDMVRGQMKMVRPSHRLVLDLSGYQLGAASPGARVAADPGGIEAVP